MPSFPLTFPGGGVSFPLGNADSMGWADAILRRDAAGAISQRNGANAQAFRVANTDDGAGNFERGIMSWQEATNVLHIGTMAGGTGSGRAVVFRGSPINFAVGGSATIIWQMNASGHFLAQTDNVYDIGASGINRPRNLYLSSFAAIGEAIAIPAGGTTGQGLRMSSTANFGVFFGSGAPTLSAAQGSIYLRSDGNSTSTRAYINTNGSTAWTAITTAS